MAQRRNSLMHLSRTPTTDGRYNLQVTGDNLTWEVDSGGPGPNPNPNPTQDVRPLLEQARSAIFDGQTRRIPLTRNTANSLLTRQWTNVRGNPILETFDRGADELQPLSRKTYEGQYITDLIADNMSIDGDALIRTYDRTGTLGTEDEWSFGFIAGALTLTFINGELTADDPANQYAFENGEIIETSDRYEFANGELIGPNLTP